MSDKTERVVKVEIGYDYYAYVSGIGTEKKPLFPKGPATLLRHEGDKIGGLTKDMVEWLRMQAREDRAHGEECGQMPEQIATAIDRILKGGTE